MKFDPSKHVFRKIDKPSYLEKGNSKYSLFQIANFPDVVKVDGGSIIEVGDNTRTNDSNYESFTHIFIHDSFLVADYGVLEERKDP